MDCSDHEICFLNAANNWRHAILRENYERVLVCDSDRMTLWKAKDAP
jgi:hypothetical protein